MNNLRKFLLGSSILVIIIWVGIKIYQYYALKKVRDLFYDMGLLFFQKIYSLPIALDQISLSYFKNNIYALIDVYLDKLLKQYTLFYLIADFEKSIANKTFSKLVNPYEYIEIQLYMTSLILTNCTNTNMKINNDIILEYVYKNYPQIKVMQCTKESGYNCFTEEEKEKIVNDFGKCGVYYKK